MRAESIPQRLTAQWRLKLLLALGLNAAVLGGYALTQGWPVFPVHPAPKLPWDDLIPFLPGTTLVYLSLLIFNAIGPLLINERAALLNYARGIVLQGAAALLCFAFLPTRLERPPPPAGVWSYELLTSIDGTINCFPSLHAALAVYGFFWARRELTECGLRSLVPAGAVWCLAILAATLTTKQHVTLDILAGGLLAALVFRCCCTPKLERA